MRGVIMGEEGMEAAYAEMPEYSGGVEIPVPQRDEELVVAGVREATDLAPEEGDEEDIIIIADDELDEETVPAALDASTTDDELDEGGAAL